MTQSKKKQKKKQKVKQYPRLYSCTQQNIISLARRVWQYCLELITDFTAISPGITATFVAAQKAKVEATALLPNNTQRKEGHVTANVELLVANAAVCRAWQTLKTFIKRAFPASLYQIKLEAAGKNNYRPAKAEKFDYTATLITDATAFMNLYMTELTANGIMSPDFPTDFAALATTFTDERKVFQDKVEEAETGTTAKDKAIREDVENPISTILELGKQLYFNDPDKLKKFTYEDLIREVRGNDPAGLKGHIYNDTDGKPMMGVEVSNGTITVLTDKKGRYEMNMASGPYDFTFKKAGFDDVTLLDKQIKVGTVSIHNLEMVPMPSESATNLAQSIAEMTEQPEPAAEVKAPEELA